MKVIYLPVRQKSGENPVKLRFHVDEFNSLPCALDLLIEVLNVAAELQGSESPLKVAIGDALTAHHQRVAMTIAATFKVQFGDAWQEKLVEVISHGKR